MVGDAIRDTNGMTTDDRPRDSALDSLRKRIRGGAVVQLDTLDDAELAAMQALLFNDEAEIINSACKPFLAAKTDRLLLPP